MSAAWIYHDAFVEEREKRRKAEAERAVAVEALRGALDAVTWMSGSPSFGPDGEAEKGWRKIRDDPEKLSAWFAVLAGQEKKQS